MTNLEIIYKMKSVERVLPKGEWNSWIIDYLQSQELLKEDEKEDLVKKLQRYFDYGNVFSFDLGLIRSNYSLSKLVHSKLNDKNLQYIVNKYFNFNTLNNSAIIWGSGDTTIKGGEDIIRKKQSNFNLILGKGHWNIKQRSELQRSTLKSYSHMKTVWGHISLIDNCTIIPVPIYCVTFSEDDNLIFTGDNNGCIKIWSTVTGALIEVIKLHESSVNDLLIYNNYLISCSEDKSVIILNIKTWQLTTTFNFEESIVRVVGYDFYKSDTGTTSHIWIINSVSGRIFFTELENSNQSEICKFFFDRNIQEKYDLKKGKAIQQTSLCVNNKNGLLICGFGDGLMCIWDIHRILMDSIIRKKFLFDFEKYILFFDSIHNALVQFADFGLNNSNFLTGSVDGTVLIWKIHPEIIKKRRDYFLTSKNLPLYECPVEKVYTISESESRTRCSVNVAMWTRNGNYVISIISSKPKKRGDNHQGSNNKRSSSLIVYSLVKNEVIKKYNDSQSWNFHDECFVLESHPTFENIVLTILETNKIVIFNFLTGEILNQFTENNFFFSNISHNVIASEGKFSNKGDTFVISTFLGFISIYSIYSNNSYNTTYMNQFFSSEFDGSSNTVSPFSRKNCWVSYFPQYVNMHNLPYMIEQPYSKYKLRQWKNSTNRLKTMFGINQQEIEKRFCKGNYVSYSRNFYERKQECEKEYRGYKWAEGDNMNYRISEVGRNEENEVEEDNNEDIDMDDGGNMEWENENAEEENITNNRGNSTNGTRRRGRPRNEDSEDYNDTHNDIWSDEDEILSEDMDLGINIEENGTAETGYNLRNRRNRNNNSSGNNMNSEFNTRINTRSHGLRRNNQNGNDSRNNRSRVRRRLFRIGGDSNRITRSEASATNIGIRNTRQSNTNPLNNASTSNQNIASEVNNEVDFEDKNPSDIEYENALNNSNLGRKKRESKIISDPETESPLDISTYLNDPSFKVATDNKSHECYLCKFNSVKNFGPFFLNQHTWKVLAEQSSASDLEIYIDYNCLLYNDFVQFDNQKKFNLPQTIEHIINIRLLCFRCSSPYATKKCSDDLCDRYYHGNFCLLRHCIDYSTSSKSLNNFTQCLDCYRKNFKSEVSCKKNTTVNMNQIPKNFFLQEIVSLSEYFPQKGEKVYFILQAYEVFLKQWFDCLIYSFDDNESIYFWKEEEESNSNNNKINFNNIKRQNAGKYDIDFTSPVLCTVSKVEYEFMKNETYNWLQKLYSKVGMIERVKILIRITLQVVETKNKFSNHGDLTSSEFQIIFFENTEPDFLIRDHQYNYLYAYYTSMVLPSSWDKKHVEIDVLFSNEIFKSELVSVKQKENNKTFSKSWYENLKIKFLEKSDTSGEVMNISFWDIYLPDFKLINKSIVSLQSDLLMHLTKIMNNNKEDISIFIDAVDEIRDGAEGYYSVVPVPMYWNLISARLKNNYYLTKESIKYDFELIRNNALWFNEKGSEVVIKAMKLVNWATGYVDKYGITGIDISNTAWVGSENSNNLLGRKTRRLRSSLGIEGNELENEGDNLFSKRPGWRTRNKVNTVGNMNGFKECEGNNIGDKDDILDLTQKKKRGRKQCLEGSGQNLLTEESVKTNTNNASTRNLRSRQVNNVSTSCLGSNLSNGTRRSLPKNGLI